MYEWTDGRMVGRTDGRTDGRTGGRSHGRTDGRTDGRADGRTDGRTAWALPGAKLAQAGPSWGQIGDVEASRTILEASWKDFGEIWEDS